MRPISDDNTLQKIRHTHIRIEGKLQQITAAVARSECAACATACCRERFCRESVECDFLRFILGSKVGEYDNGTGWYKEGAGCTLSFGRPLICYEYFCPSLAGLRGTADLMLLCRLFGKAYGRVLRKKHILEVQDITKISQGRQGAILDSLVRLEILTDDMIKNIGPAPP